MTASEAANLIGKQGQLSIHYLGSRAGEVSPAGSLTVPVTIQDAREVFGRLDVLVTPVGGTGQRWVSSERVTIGGTK